MFFLFFHCGSEPKYWYWEVIVIFKKMLLTGAMTIIAPGSSAQLTIALLIVLTNLMLLLKVGPFVDNVDDWLSFLTSLQMLLTLLGGLLLMTDDPTKPTYDSNFMGMTLVVVNSLGFLALFVSLVSLHPKVRKCMGSQDDVVGGGGKGLVKVTPVGNVEEMEANDQSKEDTGSTDTGNTLKEWK